MTGFNALTNISLMASGVAGLQKAAKRIFAFGSNPVATYLL